MQSLIWQTNGRTNRGTNKREERPTEPTDRHIYYGRNYCKICVKWEFQSHKVLVDLFPKKRSTYLHFDKHYVTWCIDIRPILKLRPKLMCILKGQSNSILNISYLFLFISYTPYPAPLRLRKKIKQSNIYQL